MRKFIVLVVLVCSAEAEAATCTLQSSGNDWASSTWSCGSPPGTSDTAIIDNASYSVSVSGTVTVDTLQMSAGTIAIASSGDLKVGHSGVSGGATITGGTISGPGSTPVAALELSNSSTVGNVTLSGQLGVTAGGTLTVTIPTNNSCNFSSLTLATDSTLNWMSGNVYVGVVGNYGTMNLTAGRFSGTFINESTGVVNVGGFFTTGSVTNQGTINIQNGVLYNYSTSSTFDNQGTLSFAGGYTNFGSVMTSEGTISGSGGILGGLNMSAGKLEVGGASTIGTIAIGRALDASSVPALFTQSGGTIYISRVGTRPGLDYDRLVLADGAALSGTSTLDVADFNGFVADAGDGFLVVSALGAVTGSFGTATVDGNAVAPTIDQNGISVGGATLLDAFESGDFFIREAMQSSVFMRVSSNGNTLRYHPAGTAGSYEGHGCSDSAGNFYATYATAKIVDKYDATGTLVSAGFYTGGPGDLPLLGCVVGKDDTVYLLANTVEQLDSNGAIAKKVDSSDGSNFEARGALAVDGCTFVYPYSGGAKTYDICQDAPLTTYDDLPLQVGEYVYGVATHPDGDVFIATMTNSPDYIVNVYRVNGNPTPLQTYTGFGFGGSLADEPVNIAIDPSGNSFWIMPDSAQQGSILTQVDIGSGNLVQQLTVTARGGEGMTIYGAISLGGGTTGGSSGGTSTSGSTGSATAGGSNGGNASTTGGSTGGSATTSTTGGASPPVTPPKKSGCNATARESAVAILALLLLHRRRRS